jgi:excisionase family DNA binding protein
VAPLLLRLKRTAEALDVSETTVKRLIRAGELPAVKVGNARCVRVADLQNYVENLAANKGETE